MNRYIFIISILTALFIMPCTFAQAPVETLTEPNSPERIYNDLKNSASLYSAKVDSMTNLLDKLRGQFEKSGSDSLVQSIINLENDIFTQRGKLNQTTVQIAGLEAQILKMQTATTTQNSRLPQSLLEHPDIKANISEKDMEVFTKSNEYTKRLITIINTISATYDQLVELKQTFDNAQTQDLVNQTIEKSLALKSEIAKKDIEFITIWNKLYNTKLDNYIVLVDKLGLATRSQLEKIDLLGRQSVQARNSNEITLAPNIQHYPTQLKLQLGYESLLAQMLGMDALALSLNNSMAKITQSKSFPEILFPYRNTLVYGDITIGNEYDYKTLQDIPILKTPVKGAYYSVQVAYVTGEASSINIFKNALPIQQEKVGTRTRYILGGFRTYAEVTKAVKDCYKFGFKAPKAVAWVNGKFVSTGEAKAYQVRNPSDAIADGYKIVVVSENSDVAVDLKSVIDIHAAGKTMSRITDPKGFLFTIMQFSNPDEAKVIAHIIKTKRNDIISVEVVEID